jgi:hypothetical protein
MTSEKPETEKCNSKVIDQKQKKNIILQGKPGQNCLPCEESNEKAHILEN